MFENFDEWAARRDIRRYNLLRLRAGLPPIAMEEELERVRMAKSVAEREFNAFVRNSPLRQRVSEKLVNKIRRERNDPQWRPFGMLSGGGLGFELDVSRRMERLWRRLHRPAQAWRREQRRVVRTEWTRSRT